MQKEKTVSICPKCHTIENVIRHGVRNGIQRYKCKKCKHVFPAQRKRVKYSKNEKTLLAMIISLMNSKKGNLSIDAVKNVADILNNIDNYQLIERQSKNDNVIFCRNPRLLLCDNGLGTVTVYRISEERTNKEIKVIDEG